MEKSIISKEYKQIAKKTILVSHLLISESNSSCAPDSVVKSKWTVNLYQKAKQENHMKTKLISFILFFPIVMLATPLLASEVVPRFKFYSSVVYDPNKSIQSWDGVFTVNMPITTATHTVL